MAFLSSLAGFAQSNPGLLASALSLFTGGLGNAAGNAGNAAMNGLNAQSEAFQVGMYAQQLQHQEQMQMISQSFDEMMDQKSENMREQNTLRDVNMAQRKADNAIVKKFIESITE
ncbi:MAG: hypothetical protein ABR508_09980 [Candidatus Baltobacteraceae bacterium]